MSPQQIAQYLQELEDQLLNGPWQAFKTSKDWLTEFPAEPGVYAIRESEQLCYIGESGNLRKRMRDLLDTRNHSLRRKIGNMRFEQEEGFTQGTASRKFPDALEEKLNQLFQTTFEVAAIAVHLGRKELEERLVKVHQPAFNFRGKRK